MHVLVIRDEGYTKVDNHSVIYIYTLLSNEILEITAYYLVRSFGEQVLPDSVVKFSVKAIIS